MNIERDSLGDRMKVFYEDVQKVHLPRRIPLILRLDGKAFHTYTRGLERPYCDDLHTLMCETAKYLCEEIQNAQIAYTQSDEITLLLHNYKRLNTDAWFGNELQKMCSVSAGMASSYFSLNSWRLFKKDLYHQSSVYELTRLAVFDCRAFILPESEVCNAFIWRQQDATRNSIQMLAQSLYSHRDLHLKNQSDLQEMCFRKGKNWNDVPTKFKRGSCVYKKEIIREIAIPFGTTVENGVTHHSLGENRNVEWFIDNEIPVFTQDRTFIEKYLEVEKENV